MAALALMTAACSNDDNELTQHSANNMITVTAKLAPKSSSALTRAVSDKGDGKITVDWAKTETMKIISNNGYEATATITNVDGTGTATITFSINANAVGRNCLIVYPASAAATTDALDFADNPALTSQDGTLNANLDVRVGAGTINADNPGTLTVTAQPAAQYSIFKFTIQNLGATAKSASQFIVSDNSGNVITTVNPGSATGELYVALPVMTAGTYWFDATIGGKPYIAKATTAATTAAGTYYQTTLKMATIGDVILSNGTFAVKGTENEQAVIANIGCLSGYFDRFIAIALTDVGKIVWSSVASNVATYAADHAITICGTTYNTNAIGDNCYDKTNSKCETTAPRTGLVKGWRLPSVTDWNYVFYGISSITSSSGARTRTLLPISKPVEYIGGSTTPPEPSAYRTAINAACGNDVLQPEDYWSSSEHQSGNETMATYGFYDNSDSRKGFGYLWKGYMYGARVRTVFAY